MTERLIIVGGCGSGWEAAALPEQQPNDSNSYGNRLFEAVRQRRVENGNDFTEALVHAHALSLLEGE